MLHLGSLESRFLIDVLGFSREVAKALIVDAAADWNGVGNIKLAPLLGHGVVPKNRRNSKVN